MISFRFHIVSLTAVFLAIAVGVVVGTTYVDRAVVENLENRIDTVSQNLDERRAQIAELDEQLDDLRAYTEASVDFTVTGRLPDVPVAVVAPRGVDGGAVEATLDLVRRAGARAPGVVWLEPAWGLEDDDARSRLATVIGSEAGRSRSGLVDDALDALARALAPTEVLEQAVAGRIVLEALVEAGFLAVDDRGDAGVLLGDLAGSGARVLVVTGTEADEPLDSVALRLTDSAGRQGLPTVVADVFVERGEGPPRGDALWSALDEEVREQLVVVDAADRPEGRAAAVLGLAEAAAGRPGRYGFGPDAGAVLPAWAAP